MHRFTPRHLGRALFLSLAVLALTGCEDDDPAVTGTSDGPMTVTGHEQVTWDQDASSLAEVNSYRFEPLIDGVLGNTLAARCNATSASQTFTCTAPLPSMSAGAHVLAIRTTDAQGNSSDPSAGIPLTMGGAGTQSFASAVSRSIESVARVCLGEDSAARCYELRQVGGGLSNPSHPTALADGRILMVDRGRLMEVQRGVVQEVAADTRPGAHVADITVPPDAAATREVYVLEVMDSGRGRSADVVRFREVNGVLGQRAVIVPGIALPSDGDPALLVNERILVAVPQRDGQQQLGMLMQYERTGQSAGLSIATPVIAWGPGRPSAMLPLDKSVAVAGTAPGGLVFGVLAPGATTPTTNVVTDRLALQSGVRAIARVATNQMLVAGGDGSLHLAGTTEKGEVTTVQQLDTRGVAVTGLTATSDGRVVGTVLLPLRDNAARGAVYQLIPLRRAIPR
jgi:hypothetical protein